MSEPHVPPAPRDSKEPAAQPPLSSIASFRSQERAKESVEAEPSLWGRFCKAVRAVLVDLIELLAPSPEGPDAIEVRSLTEQFFLTLRASFLRAPQPASNAESKRAIYAEVRRLIERGETHPSWDDNYQIEQHLVDLYDPASVQTELEMRVIEAGSVLRKEWASWYKGELDRLKQVEDEAKRTTALRTLLGRLVNDLQWRYKIREATRGYKQQISRDTAVAFVVIIAIFVVVLFFCATGSGTPAGLGRALFIAALSGAFGASFSMLINQNQRLSVGSFDDLKQLRSRVVLGSRILVGCGAAVILLVFLNSGLLAGSAFPDLADQASGEGGARLLDKTDMALLVFWCFLSGFSEKLVPALLSKTEKQVNGAEEPVGGRPTPAPSAGDAADGAKAAEAAKDGAGNKPAK